MTLTREEMVVRKPYMTIFRYQGGLDFKSARVMGLVQIDGRFHFDQMGEISTNFRQEDQKPTERDSLLTYNQSFSLSLMQADGYLTAEEVDFHQNVENLVSPEQVTFVEIGELVAPTEHDHRVTPLKERGRALKTISGLGPMHPNYVEFKKSGIWMISGQTLNPDLSKSDNPVVRTELPWQDDPDLKKEPRLQLDRNEYPFVWEFGRAGQVENNMFMSNLQALTILAYQEKANYERIMGPQKGYIFVHALGKARTKLFERVFKAKRFPRDWEDDENCILMLDIDDMINMPRYKPSKFSGRIQDLVELSGGKLSDLDALTLWFQSMNLIRKDLDVVVDGELSAEPLIWEDLSANGIWESLKPLLEEFHLDLMEQIQIETYLGKNIFWEKSANPNFTDPADLQNASSRLAKHDAIHIRNINQDLLYKDPRYLSTVLKAAIQYSSAKNVCIRTNSQKSNSILERFSSTQHKLGLGRVKTFMHCFDLATINNMDSKTGINIKDEYWNTRRLMTLPSLF